MSFFITNSRDLHPEGSDKDILCQEDLYLKELVRQIHLNPLRVKLVNNLEALNKYPYCGHPALAGMGEKSEIGRMRIMYSAILGKRFIAREGPMLGLTVEQAAPIRDELIKKGIAYSPKRGLIKARQASP